VHPALDEPGNETAQFTLVNLAPAIEGTSSGVKIPWSLLKS